MAKPKNKKPPLYYLLLSLTLALLAYGVVMIASASSVVAYVKHQDSFYFLRRQLLSIVGGLAALWLTSRFDYRRLKNISPILLVLTTATLALVLINGRAAGGATRWLVIAGFPLQPSEFVKLAIVVYAAALLANKRRKVKALGELTKPLGVPVGIVCGLIMLQPDLGTALIVAISVFAVVFLSGIRLREIIALGVAGLVGVLVLIVVEPYRMARLTAFLDPWADPRRKGFQLIQSLLAFGSGGLSGVGLGLSRQKFGYLPAPYTDFIFAVVGEELGLPGTLSIVLLFILLAFVIMRVVKECEDPFGRLMAGGIGTLIIGQALINMGGVTGLLPITGVPLPLISFGGSSLVLTLAAIGILLNLTTQTKTKRGARSEDTNLRRRNGRSRLSGAGAGRSA